MCTWAYRDTAKLVESVGVVQLRGFAHHRHEDASQSKAQDFKSLVCNYGECMVALHSAFVMVPIHARQLSRVGLSTFERLQWPWTALLSRFVSTNLADLPPGKQLDRCGVNPWSPEYKESCAAMDNLVHVLQQDVKHVCEGGGEAAVARHRSRGKMLPRERIRALLDHGSPFLEFSQLAGKDLYGKEDVPSGGIVTGIG